MWSIYLKAKGMSPKEGFARTTRYQVLFIVFAFASTHSGMIFNTS